MRLLFVVQRYGREIAGGAESACREFATRLAGRGHAVEVLTSRAQSYVDWADVYPAGTVELDGVSVHRLTVATPRSDRHFGALNARTVWGHRTVPLHLQEHWIRSSGPLLLGLKPWLAERAPQFDVVVFFSYLYYPTWAGLPVVSGLTATVLHPTAHEEPSLNLPLFQTTFRHPTAFAFFTEEEEAKVRQCFGAFRRSAVIGIGIDLDGADDDDGAAFREAHQLGERPYLLYLGRLDEAKGCQELFDFFAAFKARNPGSIALAMVGDPARPLPAHPDVIVTGVVDESMKRSALAGALALVQPSYWESFSIVLTEAWAYRKPVLAQGHSAVLEGQVRRSGGGIPSRGFAEFEAAVQLLSDDSHSAARLASSGRRYAEEHFDWPRVLDRYEQLLAVAVRTGPRAMGLASTVRHVPNSTANGLDGSAVAEVSSPLTGYWLAGADGEVHTFGDAPALGGAAGYGLQAPVVGMAATLTGDGYWLVGADGALFTFGDAPFFGNTVAFGLQAPVVGMAASMTGDGYWLVSADGGVFAFEDAPFLGSAGGFGLQAPVVGMAATLAGGGYWLVGADGGVFAFGDAPFLGSAAGFGLQAPVVGMAASMTGDGYWLAAADGGVFAFGDAPFLGSAGDVGLQAPVVGMAASLMGDGYWLLGADGGVFAFGDAPFLGSAAYPWVRTPLVAMVVVMG